MNATPRTDEAAADSADELYKESCKLKCECDKFRTALLKIRQETSANYMGHPVEVYQGALFNIRMLLDVALINPPAHEH